MTCAHGRRRRRLGKVRICWLRGCRRSSRRMRLLRDLAHGALLAYSPRGRSTVQPSRASSAAAQSRLRSWTRVSGFKGIAERLGWCRQRLPGSAPGARTARCPDSAQATGGTMCLFPIGLGTRVGQVGYGAVGEDDRSFFGEGGIGFGTPGVAATAYWVFNQISSGSPMECN